MLGWLLLRRSCTPVSAMPRPCRGRYGALSARWSGHDRKPAAPIDFFTPGKLPAYMGSCYMLLGQPKLAQRYSSEALSLLGPRARSRSFVRLDIATTLVQQRELEEACSLAADSLVAVSGDDWTPRLEQRVRDFRRSLEPFDSAGAVRRFNEEFRTPGWLD
jgi:hypothetical protein